MSSPSRACLVLPRGGHPSEGAEVRAPLGDWRLRNCSLGGKHSECLGTRSAQQTHLPRSKHNPNPHVLGSEGCLDDSGPARAGERHRHHSEWLRQAAGADSLGVSRRASEGCEGTTALPPPPVIVTGGHCGFGLLAGCVYAFTCAHLRVCLGVSMCVCGGVIAFYFYFCK